MEQKRALEVSALCRQIQTASSDEAAQLAAEAIGLLSQSRGGCSSVSTRAVCGELDVVVKSFLRSVSCSAEIERLVGWILDLPFYKAAVEWVMDVCLEWITEASRSSSVCVGRQLMQEFLRQKPSDVLIKLLGGLGDQGGGVVMHVLVEFVQDCMKDRSADVAGLLQFVECDLKQCLQQASSEMRLCIVGILAPLSVKAPVAGCLLLKSLLPFMSSGAVEQDICGLLLQNCLKEWDWTNSTIQEDCHVVSSAISTLLRSTQPTMQTANILRKLGDDLLHPKDMLMKLWITHELQSTVQDIFMEWMSKLDNLHLEDPILKLIPLLLRCYLAMDIDDRMHIVPLLLWTIADAENPTEEQLKLAFLQVFIEQCMADTGCWNVLTAELQTRVSISDLRDIPIEGCRTDVDVLVLLLHLHHQKKTEHPAEVQSEGQGCLLSSHALMKLQDVLLLNLHRISLPEEMANAAVVEVNWMSACVKFSDVHQLLESFTSLIKLNQRWWPTHSDTFRHWRQAGMISLFCLLQAVLKQWPSGQQPAFFKLALSLFGSTQISNILASAFQEMHQITDTLVKFPISAFVTLTILQLGLEMRGEVRVHASEKALSACIKFANFAVRHCSDAMELHIQENIFLEALQRFLKGVVFSHDRSVECIGEALDLWIQMSKKEDLVRNCFRVIWMHPSSDGMPMFLKRWLDLMPNNNQHGHQATAVMAVLNKFGEMADHLISLLKSKSSERSTPASHCLEQVLQFPLIVLLSMQ